MDTTIVVAIITAGVSLLLGFFNYWIGHRQRIELDVLAKERDEEKRRREKEEADRKNYAGYRVPLLDAADRLLERLKNIRERGFLTYLGTPRGDIAVKGTLFRFARFFGWAEVRMRNVERQRLEGARGESAVDQALTGVGKALATDRRGQAFMLWREEQQAIGELMMLNEEPIRMLGFASFEAQYREKFEVWFHAFSQDLLSHGATANARFADLQEALERLIDELNEGERS